MGLRSIAADLQHALALKKVFDRFKEAGMKGLLATVYALLGCIATAIVAQLTGVCPSLLANIGTIAIAGVGGFVTFFTQRPKDAPVGKALVIAALSAAFAAIVGQFRAVCGAGIVEQLPTLAAAGVWVGIGVFVSTKYHKA